MFLVYHRDPEATLSVFRNLWFHTVDLGFLDDDGYLHWVDRPNRQAVELRSDWRKYPLGVLLGAYRRGRAAPAKPHLGTGGRVGWRHARDAWWFSELPRAVQLAKE